MGHEERVEDGLRELDVTEVTRALEVVEVTCLAAIRREAQISISLL